MSKWKDMMNKWRDNKRKVKDGMRKWKEACNIWRDMKGYEGIGRAVKGCEGLMKVYEREMIWGWV
jgi:hypothetical protein